MFGSDFGIELLMIPAGFLAIFGTVAVMFLAI